MTTIVTRSGKGAALTHTEVDANFTNLNTNKAEVSTVLLASEKGAASGVCPLDSTSKVSSTYLPSYVDDVLEYANYAALPATGETGKIYVALDTNKTYRWSGSAYVYITSGAVDSVAGKTGVVTLTSTDVGLGNVTNTSDANKPISTATQTALDLKAPLASPTLANPTYTGTLTGSTGILNIGSGQVYKDASGNVGIGTSSPASKLDIGSGNLNFSGVAQRITGNMSDSTATNRLAFQSSTTNGFTNVTILPNGVSTAAGLVLEGDSAQTNGVLASFVSGAGGGTEVRIASGIRGTGTYLPITIYTGGSERLRIDASGNVGIGVSSPNSRLDARTSGITVANFQSTNANGGYMTYVGGSTTFIGASLAMLGTGTASDFAIIGSGANNFLFGTNSAERMRIDSSGKVGINVTPSASTSAKLQVTGGTTNATTLATSYSNAVVAYVPKSSSGYSLAIASGTSDLPQLQVSVNGTASGDLLIQPYGGNVGIGTSSPTCALQITNAGVAYRGQLSIDGGVGGNAQITLYNGSTTGTANLTAQILTNTDNVGVVIAASQASGYLVFRTNAGTERMRIDSSGNVGIGTSSPYNATTDVLTVTRNQNAITQLLIDNQNVGASSQTRLALEASGAGWYIAHQKTGNVLTFTNVTTERMRIDGSGNVGIGTSNTTTKLSVSKSTGGDLVYITDSSTFGLMMGIVPNLGAYINAVNNGYLRFDTNNTERMRIDSSGNLLVGKTAGSAATAGNQFGLVGAGYNESVSTNAGGTLALWYMNRQTSTGTVIEFRQASSAVGSISVTASATSFNPSSDIRLKDNITPITNGIERVSKLRPVDYTWKIDGTKDNGFIAQDLLKMPEFANRVNSIGKADDGSDLYGVDYMKFVSVLTAAIQELKAIIDTQQEQINSLLGK